MDDQQFDNLSRRVGALALPRLPRRGLLHLLGGAALAGSLGLLAEPDEAAAKKKKCKKEGKGCNKNKCKKKNKKCCCKNLKCKNDVCEGEGSQCPIDVEFADDWTDFDSPNGPDEFDLPLGITVDEDGNVYVVDNNNFRILTFDSDGNLLDEFGEQGNENDQFQEPNSVGFNQNNDGNNRILVTDPAQGNTDRRFRSFRTNGNFEDNLGRNDLTNPTGIGVDNDDRIWVVDTTNPGQVFRFNPDGENPDIVTPGGSGQLNNPQGIAIFEDKSDDNTYVFVTDTGSDRVFKFEFTNGALAFRLKAGETGSGSEAFNQPIGIAVDKCGNVWVADRINDRIQILDKNLEFLSNFKSSFDRPVGVAFSPDGETLYVTDSENDRVVLFTLS